MDSPVVPVIAWLSVHPTMEMHGQMIRRMAAKILRIAFIFERFLYIFQYAQWPLFAVIVTVYWFRCNVKAYNYSFTQSVSAKIRKQLNESDALVCPRCNKPMSLKRFTEKIRERTGEHEEYYTEWINFGQKDSYTITRAETVPEYSNVEYKRQYAICENPYCMYKDKRPSKRAVALYKFAEMPYKVSDTINYAVRTKAETNQAAGDIQQYSHGIPLLSYLGISIVMLIICTLGNLPCFALLDQRNDLFTFLINLAISECIFLCFGIILQIAVHIHYNKQVNDSFEIKHQTKDGATIVLSDGTEFYARSDRQLQNIVDSMYSNDPSLKKDE